MAAPNVKPCPFCGAVPDVTGSDDAVWINCETVDCPASPISSGDAPNDGVIVIDRWNTRADAPELVALVDEMKTFCRLVEIGEVRSKRSYAAFKAAKAAIAAYEALK